MENFMNCLIKYLELKNQMNIFNLPKSFLIENYVTQKGVRDIKFFKLFINFWSIQEDRFKSQFFA